MKTARKKLQLSTDTLRTISSATLDRVVGGAASAAEAQANLGGIAETKRCIISCFCTNDRLGQN